MLSLQLLGQPFEPDFALGHVELERMRDDPTRLISLALGQSLDHMSELVNAAAHFGCLSAALLDGRTSAPGLALFDRRL